jgi:hypothetical protein
MKRIIIGLSAALIFGGCQKHSEDNRSLPKAEMSDLQSNISSVQASEPTKSLPPLEPQYRLSPTEVTTFVQNIYKRIEEDEQYLKDAVDSKDVKGLTDYGDRWNAFAFSPYRDPPPNTTPRMGQKYWPNSDDADPYIACDEAINELSSLANMYKFRITSDAAWVRGGIREHESTYHKAKLLCKKRIDMTYEQAEKASEND